MGEQEVILLITVPSVVFIIITSGIIYLLYTYFKTKQQFLIEKQQRELAFAVEVQQVQSDIQDQTLQFVGKELHDNIGQLLMVSKIHSQSLLKAFPDHQKTNALDEIIGTVIQEVKGLSRSLDNRRVANFGLLHELHVEKLRVEAASELKIEINMAESIQIKEQEAMILYRIIQEFISNAVKYSKATTVHIDVLQEEEIIHVMLADNGIGFDTTQTTSGSGLWNMKERAALLQATSYQLVSETNQGTKLSFNWNYKH